ncbi:hypothetical protein T484DRAFT_2564848 [Baffinella frigidus]|nr:hypothetical protein T484DRAFT_2564848 [Cryptophyta sp. CCMP2293]
MEKLEEEQAAQAAIVEANKGLAPVPEMLLTQEERRSTVFRSKNAMVEDPVDEELSRSMVNVWSEEEKQVFMEKLVDFSVRPEREGVKKNFYAISHFLPNKTTRDCVQFYYMNKKTKYFKQMYKKFELKHRKSYSLKNKYRNRDDSNQVYTPKPLTRVTGHAGVHEPAGGAVPLQPGVYP